MELFLMGFLSRSHCCVAFPHLFSHLPSWLAPISLFTSPSLPLFLAQFISLISLRGERKRRTGGGRGGSGEGRGDTRSASFSHPRSNASLLGCPTSAQETSLCYHCQLAGEPLGETACFSLLISPNNHTALRCIEGGFLFIKTHSEQQCKPYKRMSSGRVRCSGRDLGFIYWENKKKK